MFTSPFLCLCKKILKGISVFYLKKKKREREVTVICKHLILLAVLHTSTDLLIVPFFTKTSLVFQN